MPLSELDPFENFIFRVKSLKRNPKTYRTYRYSARVSGSIRLEAFGNRLYFISAPPSGVNVRFNEAENDSISVTKRMGLQQDFYRIYLDWPGTGTDEEIVFVVGFDLDIVDLQGSDVNPRDLLYSNTIVAPGAVATYGPWFIGESSQALIEAYVEGTPSAGPIQLVLYSGFISTNCFIPQYKSMVETGIGTGKYYASWIVQLANRYAKLTLSNPAGLTQTLLNISLRTI